MPRSTPRADLLQGAEPLFLAKDREALVEALDRIYRARATSAADDQAPVAGLANRATLDMVTLHYCRYEATTEIAFVDMPGFRQFFCLGGAGRIAARGAQIELSSRSTGIVTPGGGFNAEYGPGYAHLVLQIDEGALERLRRAWDENLSPNALPALQSLEAESLARLRNLVLCLAEQFDRPHSRNDLAIAQLEQAVASSFLFDNLMRGESLSGRRSGARLARRLQDYIEANWDKPLKVEDLAKACGVGARSVFLEFGQRFGVTPMAFLRDVRLDRARGMLSQKDSTLSVIDVAIRCGFASFGHFARRYRERFGELPSETLARARGRPV